MKKAAAYLLLASQLLVITGFWFVNHWNHPMGNQFTGDMIGKLLAYGRLAGLLAAFATLLQLILAGRVKWVERIFGLDRLMRLHGYIGFSFVIFLLAHPLLVTAGHAMQADVSMQEQSKDFLKNWPGVFTATIAFVIMVFATWMSVLMLRKTMRYEIWHATHLTFYVAIALVFGHQIAVGGDFTGSSSVSQWFKVYWCALYIFVFGNLILYRLIRPYWFYLRHRFIVTRIFKEADDVTSVYIEGRDMENFPVQAGQFMIVRFLAPGFRWEGHPFSMSCMPDGKHMRLTIKALGDYTRRIPELKPGTHVIIDGPHGVFASQRCASQKVLMIAGGIGITPLRSLSEEMSAAGRDVVLIYANRNLATLVFAEELDALAAASSGRLRVIPVLSDDPGYSGEKGRLDREKLARFVPDILERDIYLCGPPVMMKLVRGTLSGMGVRHSRIHYERFAL